MREAVPFVLLACACGMAARPTTPFAAPPAPVSRPPATPEPNVFASMEARGASVAPGMRLAARRVSTGERVEIVRADQSDTCIRVAFEALVPVVAKLVDDTNNAVATSGAAAVEGVLGERGPVCIRRGEALGVTVEGTGVPVRWVAWAAP